jgi:hypothetical protein
MRTLDDAWQWYNDVKESLKRMSRRGSRYWDHIPWEEDLWKSDKHFSELSKEALTGAAEHGLEHLDDLAIVVLFSVFEAVVRGAILEQITAETTEYQHRAIVEALETAKEKIGEGSFFNVLFPFNKIDAPLFEQVHQVRKYRNWVSHGKRGGQPPNVIPLMAYQRLQRCLAVLFPPIPDDWIAVGAYYVWEDNTRPGAKDSFFWNKAKVNLQEMVRTGQLTLPPS